MFTARRVSVVLGHAQGAGSQSLQGKMVCVLAHLAAVPFLTLFWPRLVDIDVDFWGGGSVRKRASGSGDAQAVAAAKLFLLLDKVTLEIFLLGSYPSRVLNVVANHGPTS